MTIPALPNALTNIEKACIEKLNQLYPHGIPEEVRERYETEFNYLKESSFVDDFELFRILSNEAQKSTLYITLQGVTSGSYLVYLLGHGRYNPLPPHFYCPQCGHFEIVNTHLFGIDMPSEPCPFCGTRMNGDGFRIPVQSIWGMDGKKHISFEYNVPDEFYPFSLRTLEKLYPHNDIVPYGIESFNNMEYMTSNPFNIVKHGYIILPDGHTFEDYQEYSSYLEDGTPCICTHELYHSSVKIINFTPTNDIELLIQLQRKFGYYVTEITTNDLYEINYNDYINCRTLSFDETSFLKSEKPKTFFDITNWIALAHNTYNLSDHSPDMRFHLTVKEIVNTPEFQKYPLCTREDFYETFIEYGINEADAYELYQAIWKGRANYQFLQKYNLPDELKTLIQKCHYLFPRAHTVEHMLCIAKLAYYMKLDSRIYSRLISKFKSK